MCWGWHFRPLSHTKSIGCLLAGEIDARLESGWCKSCDDKWPEMKDTFRQRHAAETNLYLHLPGKNKRVKICLHRSYVWEGCYAWKIIRAFLNHNTFFLVHNSFRETLWAAWRGNSGWKWTEEGAGVEELVGVGGWKRIGRDGVEKNTRGLLLGYALFLSG